MSVLATRRHPRYVAFIVHRISGVALALFLPLHLWVLGLALDEGARLDAFLQWTQQPLPKLLETLLVAALAVHLGGGIRLLSIEFVGWSERQGRRIAAGFAFALAVGLLYLLA